MLSVYQQVQNAQYYVSFVVLTLIRKVLPITPIFMSTLPKLARLSQMLGSGITKPLAKFQVPTSLDIADSFLMV